MSRFVEGDVKNIRIECQDALNRSTLLLTWTIFRYKERMKTENTQALGFPKIKEKHGIKETRL